MKKRTTKKLEKELLEIVHNFIGLEDRTDLEEHKTDDEDFFETSIWGLKDALLAAYELGKQSK